MKLTKSLKSNLIYFAPTCEIIAIEPRPILNNSIQQWENDNEQLGC
ncbi:MAG: hypothetical protein KBS95_03865 [Alistipes sp.]|nr:hypothetical protein [Candidatus Alistipes equi]